MQSGHGSAMNPSPSLGGKIPAVLEKHSSVLRTLVLLIPVAATRPLPKVSPGRRDKVPSGRPELIPKMHSACIRLSALTQVWPEGAAHTAAACPKQCGRPAWRSRQYLPAVNRLGFYIPGVVAGGNGLGNDPVARVYSVGGDDASIRPDNDVDLADLLA